MTANRKTAEWPLWTAGMALAAVLVYASGEAVQEVLQYDRGAMAGGALWRLLSQHWTHWSADHLIWDVVVFVALGAVCELRNRRRFLSGVGSAAVAISVGLMLLSPSLLTCRGLSGIDSALFALLAADWLRQGGGRRLLGIAAVVLFLGKCTFEHVTGTALFVDAAATATVPVPLAHWIGFACGVACAWSRDASPSQATVAVEQLA
jgi:rhomboid family GlyGly-CTERM serine protease